MNSGIEASGTSNGVDWRLTAGDRAARDAALDDWRRLSQEAEPPNPFFDPQTIGALLAPQEEAKVGLFTVRKDNALVALWPVRIARSAGLGARYLESWTHPHVYFGAPLIAKGAAPVFADALCDLLGGRGVAAFASMPNLDAGGDVHDALRTALRSRKNDIVTTGRFERALLNEKLDPDDYADRCLSRNLRKQIRAKRRKLNEIAPLRVEKLAAGDNLHDWFDIFLRLEHAGWKGRQGTSLASDPHDALRFRRMIDGFREAGALRFMRLCLGDKVIASSIDIFAGDGGYALKIAHDPDYDRYSPGVIMELEALRDFLVSDRPLWIDSCASPEHAVLDRLWQGRRAIANIYAAKPDAASRAAMLAHIACRAAADRIARAPFASRQKDTTGAPAPVIVLAERPDLGKGTRS